MLIPLTQQKFAEVDLEDYDWLSTFKWHYKSGYAARTVRGDRVWMHNEISGAESWTDHRNRNGLDNRRSNLRIADRSLQGHNRLMPKRNLPRGVSFHEGKYQASIRVKHKLVYLGRYNTPEIAEAVYIDKCIELYGEAPPRWE